MQPWDIFLSKGSLLFNFPSVTNFFNYFLVLFIYYVNSENLCRILSIYLLIYGIKILVANVTLHNI